jgi:hypothetical protein
MEATKGLMIRGKKRYVHMLHNGWLVFFVKIEWIYDEP